MDNEVQHFFVSVMENRNAAFYVLRLCNMQDGNYKIYFDKNKYKIDKNTLLFKRIIIQYKCHRIETII